ncbi:MAG: T9SS type A sorting domain-containing protein, partial [Bacteroidota bacterium]
FQRHPFKTGYLRKDYNGGDEDYWHMVDETYNYASVSNSNMLGNQLPFTLGKNYPNPVREMTHIPYQIQKPGHMLMEVLNEQGRIVDILANKKEIPGNHMITWNATKHPAGLYLYRMRFEGVQYVGKMIVIH